MSERARAICPILIRDEGQVLDQAIGLAMYDPERFAELGRGASQQYLPCGDATTARILQQSEIRKDAVRMLRAIARQPNLLIDTAECLPTFERPALVVWASEDRVMPPEHGRRLTDLLPDARLVEIANSYTLLSLDQPAEFAGVIREFVMESAVDVPALSAELLDGTS